MIITLYWRIPSKKNSKVWTWKFMISSKNYIKREKEQLIYLKQNQIKPENINYWVSISYEFFMPDNRKTDLSNKIESINDLLVKYWLLEDDNCKIIQEMNIYYKWIDRENPRCKLEITKLDN